jgi:CO/xanthine dehydrogenase FAD-binding subunit
MLVARPTTLSGAFDVDALPALAAAARNVRSPHMRGPGTVGGNVGIEQSERGSAYGAKGTGDPLTISSTGGVLAAIRRAAGLPLNRIPVRPDDIALFAEPATSTG